MSIQTILKKTDGMSMSRENALAENRRNSVTSTIRTSDKGSAKKGCLSAIIRI